MRTIKSLLRKEQPFFHLCLVLLISFFSSNTKAEHSYQVVVASNLNWQQAWDSALAMGGNLVTITSQAERDAVNALVTTGRWWIGATDYEQEGNWQWVTGETWTYTNWASGEPNNNFNEDAAFIYVSQSHKWFDGGVTGSVSGFILERGGSTDNGPFPGYLNVDKVIQGGFVSHPYPVIAWRYVGSESPQVQYEIEIGTDQNWDIPEMWSSGQVASSDSLVTYAGLPLIDDSVYYCRVRVYDGTTWGVWVYRKFTYADVSAGPKYLTVIAPSISWQRSRDSANKLGGHMVTITDSSESDIVAEVVPFGDWWIGATDEVTEGNWQWITGEAFHFTKWYDGEPNNSFDEDYAFYSDRFGQAWIDHDPAYGAEGFILEIPINGPHVTALGFAEPYAGYYAGSRIPTIIWNYQNRDGGPQQRYEIEVGTDTDWNTAELWATGPITSSATETVYSGNRLENDIQYVMRVRVGDSASWGMWSELSFHVFDLSEHSYQFVSVVRGWQQASDSAQLAGGYLATVANPVEGAYINSLSGGAGYHLGATDREVEGIWKWVTGEPFSYTHWSWGKPDNFLGADYLEVWVDKGRYWIDGSGSNLSFVIEWDATPRIQSVLIDNVPANSHVLTANPTITWVKISDTLVQDSVEVEIGTDFDWLEAEMWNPAIFHTADTTMLYNGLPLTDGFTYYCRIRIAYDTVWSPWAYAIFRMNSKPIPPPSSPAVVTYNTVQPSILIQHGTDAENDSLSYYFESFYDSALTVSIGIDSTGRYHIAQPPTWDVSRPFLENSQVWWRCKVYDGYEYSNWSNTTSLIIDAVSQTPSVVVLLSPPNQTAPAITDLTPALHWNKAIDNDPFDTIFYLLEIAPDQNFLLTTRFDSLQTTSFEIPDSLLFGTQYWWQVTSYDKLGNSFGSPLPFTFWTWTLGDLNHSHNLTIEDLVFFISFLFHNGPAPTQPVIADLDQNCTISILDIIYMVQYLFSNGPAPKVGCVP